MTRPSPYRPRRFVLRDGRVVTLRAIAETDAPAIRRAFDRLSTDSRYQRFLHHKKQLSPEALDRGVHPRPGQDFAFVATVPRGKGKGKGIDVVGAAQYVRARPDDASTCEFAVTVAEGWRSGGLARRLLSGLLRRAPRDGYTLMEGLVLASNGPMLALARRLKFTVEPAPQEGAVVRVLRELAPLRPRPA
ncbi:MAG: GNAT family N-acetyltransferase [Rubrivivax sp.]|nr:GNAT family N-acetyltransferase [Rubrivivax sp.]